MEGPLRSMVGLSVIVIALLVSSAVAGAQTFSAPSYPYARDAVLSDSFDSHEISATVGKQISYTVRATGSGCILVYFTLGHNVNQNSYFLPAYSQETCVTSFSKSYTVPSGGGPDYSIVVTSEAQGGVPYHIDISVGDPGLGSAGGVLAFVILAAVVGGVGAAIGVAVRRRKKAPAQAPTWAYPPPYAPGALEPYPPLPSAAPPPAEPSVPPNPPPGSPPAA